MKKVQEMKFKTPLIIISLVLFFSFFFSIFLIRKVSAENYNQSVLRDFLQVIASGSFGGGIVTGLDNPDYGLVVASGKVGIGTTSPEVTLHVVGDAKIQGNVLSSPRLTCPVFIDTGRSIYGFRSWPTTVEYSRYNGYVNYYGVMVDEISSGSDERLAWAACNDYSSNSSLSLDQISFSFPGIYDAGNQTLFRVHPSKRDPINPGFKQAIATYEPTRYIQDGYGAEFCEELGLVHVSSIDSINAASHPCSYFNSSNNRWENSSSCFLMLNSITCRLPQL